MSQNRDYELVYIVSPETSEQDVAELTRRSSRSSSA